MAIDGKKIYMLRVSSKPYVTRTAVANTIGLDQHQLAKIENGTNLNPQLCTVFRIANYFNVTVDELIIKDSDCCS